MYSSYILWGEKEPQFIFYDRGVIVQLPQPSNMDYFFDRDAITHNIITGKIRDKLRWWRLDCKVYYDYIDKQLAMYLRDIINYCQEQGRTLQFKPHRDFPAIFDVKVNEKEGWNFKLVKRKQVGYTGLLHIRSVKYIGSLDRTEYVLLGASTWLPATT